METLGVYLQVPFCASKCSFCNFSSKVVPAVVLDTYSSALELEMSFLPELYRASGIEAAVLALPVDTVYLGGGTPSLLDAGRLQRIVTALRASFELCKVMEFTLEVTPGSADDDLLRDLRRLGVNRLSVGAQSFDDRELCAVGRLHSAATTHDLVGRARRLGFGNISLDLIAGLPYQTESSWRKSLQEAQRLRPEHLSVYLFEVDEKSRLGSEVLRHGKRYGAGSVPDDDFVADAYQTAGAALSEIGYLQYEISNWALPGFESRHNQRYWQLKPYIGLGAGAHSFDGRCRWANQTAPEAYQDKLKTGATPVAELRALSSKEQLEEFFFLGLRQTGGVDLTRARQRWGEDEIARWEPKISVLAAEGWLEARNGRLCLSRRAYLVSNEVFQEFLT